MTFKGVVKEIVFRNDETSYTIAVLTCDGKNYTVVGFFPPVSEGHYLNVTGTFINHPRFGRQLKAESVRFDKPDSKQGMILFLGSGLIRGVGPKRAELIVEHFGDKTFEVIENDPSRLALIKGISAQIAQTIAHSYAEVSGIAEAITFLVDNGVSTNLAMKVISAYGEKTIDYVTQNPYSMIEDIGGVGFLTADKIANNIGIDFSSPFRVKAGLYYTIRESAEKNGNTAVPSLEAVEETRKLLSLDDSSSIENCINEMVLTRKIKRVFCDDVEALMLIKYYHAERSSAVKLISLMQNATGGNNDWGSMIERFEKMNKIQFHDSQKQAIISALSNGVCVITGGPGTGKTTIIRCVTSILKEIRCQIKLMAPTGRAARRLGEASNEEATTIHRALMADEGFMANAIIIDEFSMVDAMLLSRTLDELPEGCKLVMVGDSDQLPSVGAGNVLYDIINSNVIPTVKLTQIFRQEECGHIIINAHKVNNGEMPSLSNESKDFFYMQELQPVSVANRVVELVSTRLPKYLKCDPKQVQVLCPMKVGEAGSINLNARLQSVFIDTTECVKVGDCAFYVGDKVMHTVNNYNLVWKKNFAEGQGVFNGDVGIITALSVQRNQIEVLLEDGRKVLYEGENKSQLMLAYAITVHKSQGSEYEGVVIALSGGHGMIMTRNLLYTAITRAKNMVVIVGKESTISQMVKNNFIKKRYSQLKTMLIEEKNRNEKLYSFLKGQ